MNVGGNYNQYAGTLYVAIAGTNTAAQGAQQYDQLLVAGRANLLGGSIAVGLFDPDNQTNTSNAFQPPVDSSFDVIVAQSIFLRPEFAVRGQVFADGRFFQWSVVDRPDGAQALRMVVTNIPPVLGLVTSTNTVQVGYATNYAGYVIQSSPAASPLAWTTITSDTNVVTLPATNQALLFRARKP
jgi:hypothetical protein